jgi:hypothetical protein
MSSVLQLFPKPPAHVAGSSTPLHNSALYLEQIKQIETLHLIIRKTRISYHSLREKKMFLLELSRASLILVYLHFFMNMLIHLNI